MNNTAVGIHLVPVGLDNYIVNEKQGVHSDISLSGFLGHIERTSIELDQDGRVLEVRGQLRPRWTGTLVRQRGQETPWSQLVCPCCFMGTRFDWLSLRNLLWSIAQCKHLTNKIYLLRHLDKGPLHGIAHGIRGVAMIGLLVLYLKQGSLLRIFGGKPTTILRQCKFLHRKLVHMVITKLRAHRRRYLKRGGRHRCKFVRSPYTNEWSVWNFYPLKLIKKTCRFSLSESSFHWTSAGKFRCFLSVFLYTEAQQERSDVFWLDFLSTEAQQEKSYVFLSVFSIHYKLSRKGHISSLVRLPRDASTSQILCARSKLQRRLADEHASLAEAVNRSVGLACPP